MDCDIVDEIIFRNVLSLNFRDILALTCKGSRSSQKEIKLQISKRIIIHLLLGGHCWVDRERAFSQRSRWIEWGLNHRPTVQWIGGLRVIPYNCGADMKQTISEFNEIQIKCTHMQSVKN